MKRIPLLDLPSQHSEIREELLATLTRVVDSGRFILGEEVEALEREIAAVCGARFAVGCASGSDALYLALRAVGAGPDHRVITSAFSFFASAGSVAWAGATPVFADIDPATLNLSPDSLEEAFRRHERVAAILPVHLYGGSADLDPILALAKQRDCPVIEDGAQSIGAEYKGRRVNALGDAGCLSFFPTKNLGGFGDGGMVLTNNERLAHTLRLLRVHGGRNKYEHEIIGVNSRLDAIQAAILRVKLPHLDVWTQRRETNAALYRELLAGTHTVQLPAAAAYQTRHVWNQFVVRCSRRDALREFLDRNGVATEIYYPIPLHLQQCFRDLGYREGDLPEAERAAREVLALPVHPTLESSDIERVCELIRSWDGPAR